MSDQVPLQFLPLQPHEFHSLPDGFEYPHEISEASNTTAFDTGVDSRDLGRCVWDLLKNTGFVPRLAKSAVHEPRNGINLCDSHHSDFDGYRFFIRWVPSDRVFVLVNFSRDEYLEQFHGKTVALDPDHSHSPFPAPFLIQEMRTRGFHPWSTDRPIPRPLHPTYALVDNGDGGGVVGGFSGMMRSGGTASSSSVPTSNVQYLVLSNPFQDPELLESMRHQWQRLPSWKSATVEGLTWEGTAEENAKKYMNFVGVAHQ